MRIGPENCISLNKSGMGANGGIDWRRAIGPIPLPLFLAAPLDAFSYAILLEKYCNARDI